MRRLGAFGETLSRWLGFKREGWVGVVVAMGGRRRSRRSQVRGGSYVMHRGKRVCLFWLSPTVYPPFWLQFATVVHSQDEQNFPPPCMT